MVASLFVVVGGLKLARDLLLPLLVAAFLAMISLPLLNWQRSRRVPTAIAVPVTFLAAIAFLAAVIFLIGGSLSGLTEQVPKYQARLDAMSDTVEEWIEDRGFEVPDNVVEDLINPGAALDMVTGTLRTAVSVVSNVVLVFLTIAFILFEAAGFPEKLRAAFGRTDPSHRFEKIKAEVQLYLGMKTLISLATGVLVALALAAIGIDFPLLWGTVAFFLNYIPNLGSMLAAAPPVLLGFVQIGPGAALGVAAVFVTVNFLLGNMVEPYLMGRRLGLSTLVVFLSLVFWGWVWGPIGMLLSVPLTMIVKIMLENTEDLRWIAVLLDASPARPRAPAARPTGRPA